MIIVSVIVPVYKVPLEYLRECFNSLTAQTMQDCEFIVISDGAPEEECTVCKNYAEQDSRFKFFKREHAGVSAARNYGIEQAQGEYITFVDADDTLLNNAIEICYKNAKQWDSDILAFNYSTSSQQSLQTNQKAWQATSLKKITEKQRISILEEFIHLKSSSIPRSIWGKFYLKKFILNNKISFKETLSMGEDLVFNFHCFSATANISYLCETFYFYRNNPKSATNVFDPNFFYNRSAPILEIKKNFPNKYEKIIYREILAIFFQSWPFCYLNQQNKQSLCSRVKGIKKIIHSELFQSAVSKAATEDICSFVKFELFLFKNKITFPVWLHAIKACLFK